MKAQPGAATDGNPSSRSYFDYVCALLLGAKDVSSTSIDELVLSRPRDCSALESAATELRMVNSRDIFRGDGMLWRSDALNQRVFMVLMNTEAILEAVAAFGEPEGLLRNRTTTRNSHESIQYDAHGLIVNVAGGPYGAYRNVRSASYFQFPALGLSLGKEWISGSQSSGRNIATAETALGGIVNDWFAAGIAVGYSVYREGEREGCGPMFRLGVVLPSTDVTVSVYFRRLGYRVQEDTIEKWTQGLRIDAGYSIFGLYLAYGRDYGFDSGDNLISGSLWSAGAQIQIPLGWFMAPFFQSK
jgi:hypothetical protein